MNRRSVRGNNWPLVAAVLVATIALLFVWLASKALASTHYNHVSVSARPAPSVTMPVGNPRIPLDTRAFLGSSAPKTEFVGRDGVISGVVRGYHYGEAFGPLAAVSVYNAHTCSGGYSEATCFGTYNGNYQSQAFTGSPGDVAGNWPCRGWFSTSADGSGIWSWYEVPGYVSPWLSPNTVIVGFGCQLGEAVGIN